MQQQDTQASATGIPNLAQRNMGLDSHSDAGSRQIYPRHPSTAMVEQDDEFEPVRTSKNPAQQ
jgi:hypothetical protein